MTSAANKDETPKKKVYLSKNKKILLQLIKEKLKEKKDGND